MIKKAYILTTRHKTKTGEEKDVRVYDDIRKAQSQMAANIFSELSYKQYEHVLLDGTKDKTLRNLPQNAMRCYDDPEFNFNIRKAELWNGNRMNPEEYITYNITEHEII